MSSRSFGTAILETLEGRRLLAVSIGSVDVKTDAKTEIDSLTITDGSQGTKIAAKIVQTGTKEIVHSFIDETGQVHSWTQHYGLHDVYLNYGRLPQMTFHEIGFVNIYANGGNDEVSIAGIGMSDATNHTFIDLGDGDDTFNAGLISGKGKKKKNRFGFDGGLQIEGGNGNDVIKLSGAFPKDILLDGWNHYRNASGGNGHDLFVGSSADDGFYGNAGNDTIRAGAGNDILIGGEGTNLLMGDDGSDTYYKYPVNGLYPGDLWNRGGSDRIIDKGDPNDADTIVYFYPGSLSELPDFGENIIAGIEEIHLIAGSGESGKG